MPDFIIVEYVQQFLGPPWISLKMVEEKNFKLNLNYVEIIQNMGNNLTVKAFAFYFYRLGYD